MRISTEKFFQWCFDCDYDLKHWAVRLWDCEEKAVMESTKDCEMLDHNITDPQFVMEQVKYVHITKIRMMLSRKRRELSEIRW